MKSLRIVLVEMFAEELGAERVKAFRILLLEKLLAVVHEVDVVFAFLEVPPELALAEECLELAQLRWTVSNEDRLVLRKHESEPPVQKFVAVSELQQIDQERASLVGKLQQSRWSQLFAFLLDSFPLAVDSDVG